MFSLRWKMLKRLVIVLVAAALTFNQVSCLSQVTTSAWKTNLAEAWRVRVAADPSFLAKSCAEVALAAGLQLSAEWQRRGAAGLVTEIDFVFAGVLTAIIGKYYSMWKVAPTQLDVRSSEPSRPDHHSSQPYLLGMPVPTNAFQKTMLDGRTRPSLKQRFGSMIVPMVPLFRAGFAASAAGYGLTAGLIQLRTLLMPNYVAATRSINILYACLYTGSFMALVSNIRYQILQGLVEPFLEKSLPRIPWLKASFILAVRILNGFVGSVLAISGMKWLGLQRLK